MAEEHSFLHFLLKGLKYSCMYGVLLFIVGMIWYSSCKDTERYIAYCGPYKSTRMEDISRSVTISGGVVIGISVLLFMSILFYLFRQLWTEQQNQNNQV